MKPVFGGIMIAVGVLVAGASGLCSILFLSPAGGLEGPPPGDLVAMVLIIGGIPFIAGILLVVGGYFLARRNG